jgi:hypothetical protein
VLVGPFTSGLKSGANLLKELTFHSGSKNLECSLRRESDDEYVRYGSILFSWILDCILVAIRVTRYLFVV